MLNLTKWYCDCVGQDGAAFLGYWAQLRRGPFTIPYSATLYKPAHGAPREHTSVRRCPPPVLDGTGLHWNCQRLHVKGWWSPYAPAHQHTLYQSSAGEITWRCFVPGAEASIDIGGRDRISGLGYAELLTVSISHRSRGSSGPATTSGIGCFSTAPSVPKPPSTKAGSPSPRRGSTSTTTPFCERDRWRRQRSHQSPAPRYGWGGASARLTKRTGWVIHEEVRW